MNKNQRNNLIASLNASHTLFFTLRLPTTARLSGVPIGDGKCKGVALKINQFVLNTTTGTSVATSQAIFYVGDSSGQFFEINPFIDPVIIPCQDLSDIYIRGVGYNNVGINCQVYLSDEDIKEWKSK